MVNLWKYSVSYCLATTWKWEFFVDSTFCPSISIKDIVAMMVVSSYPYWKQKVDKCKMIHQD